MPVSSKAAGLLSFSSFEKYSDNGSDDKDRYDGDRPDRRGTLFRFGAVRSLSRGGFIRCFLCVIRGLIF
jgi:hypothetical protein